MLTSFYVGSTQVPLEERVEKHQIGYYISSYTKKTNDWELFLSIPCDSFGQARKIENHIKRMKSKKYIQSLKKYPEVIQKLLFKYAENK